MPPRLLLAALFAAAAAAGRAQPLPAPRPRLDLVRLAAAGGFAGSVANAALHPLGTAKTLRQARPEEFTNTFGTLYALLRQGPRGVRRLYAGAVPAVVGAAPSSAVYFGTYEATKRRLRRALAARRAERGEAGGPTIGGRALIHLTAAACGNAASSVLFVPKELVKQRMQLYGAQAGGSALSVLKAVVAERGVGGLYAAWAATLLRNMPSAALRFVVYEEVSLLLGAHVVRGGPQYVLAGALAGGLASGCTTPLDVVKTRLNVGSVAAGTSVGAALRDIVAAEGLGGLYAGVGARVVKSALFGAIGFAAFEEAKERLGVGNGPAAEAAVV